MLPDLRVGGGRRSASIWRECFPDLNPKSIILYANGSWNNSSSYMSEVEVLGKLRRSRERRMTAAFLEGEGDPVRSTSEPITV